MCLRKKKKIAWDQQFLAAFFLNSVIVAIVLVDLLAMHFVQEMTSQRQE